MSRPKAPAGRTYSSAVLASQVIRPRMTTLHVFVLCPGKVVGDASITAGLHLRRNGLNARSTEWQNGHVVADAEPVDVKSTPGLPQGVPRPKRSTGELITKIELVSRFPRSGIQTCRESSLSGTTGVLVDGWCVSPGCKSHSLGHPPGSAGGSRT